MVASKLLHGLADRLDRVFGVDTRPADLPGEPAIGPPDAAPGSVGAPARGLPAHRGAARGVPRHAKSAHPGPVPAAVPAAAPAAAAPGYPGDFHGVPRMAYAPRLDGPPDAGEVVLTWVPYLEDPSMGKHRLVLVIGSDNGWLLGLAITSGEPGPLAPHHRVAEHARVGIGPGPWRPDGGPGEVRVDRIIRVNPWLVRRDGVVLGQEDFDAVAEALRGLTPPP